MLEALFAVRREEHPRFELGRSKSLLNLKMEGIFSSETPILN
jgi:hypothetical protein